MMMKLHLVAAVALVAAVLVAGPAAAEQRRAREQDRIIPVATLSKHVLSWFSNDNPEPIPEIQLQGAVAGWPRVGLGGIIRLKVTGATPLWYRYNGVVKGEPCWSWTPYESHSEWIDAPDLVVKTGKWRGQKPVHYNREIITFLGKTCTKPGRAPAGKGPMTSQSSLPIIKVYPHEQVYSDLVGVAKLAPATGKELEAIKVAAAMSKDKLARHASQAYAAYQRKHVEAFTHAHGPHACMYQDVAGWASTTPREASLAGWLASKAYDMGNEKGTVRAGVTLTAPGGTKLQVLHVDHNGRRTKHLGDFNGPFFVARSGDKLWVVVRGSATAADWVKDLTATWTDVSFLRAGGETVQIGNMHRGFAELWHQYYFSVVMANVFRKHPELATQIKHVRFAGHSLGGALAQILALEYHVRFGGAQPSVYTFGSPRVGGSALHQWLHDHTIHYRFRHQHDAVPTVPSYDVKCTLELGLNKNCEHFTHNADVSIRLEDADKPAPHAVCIAENNSQGGFSIGDHMMAGYLKSLSEMASKPAPSRATGATGF